MGFSWIGWYNIISNQYRKNTAANQACHDRSTCGGKFSLDFARVTVQYIYIDCHTLNLKRNDKV